MKYIIILVLFIFISHIPFVYSGIAEKNQKVLALITENRLQEAAWIASELEDEEFAQELEGRIETIFLSSPSKFLPFSGQGISKPYLLEFENGITGILKADAWKWSQPLSWIFGEGYYNSSDAEIATSQLDRLFRFNIVPLTIPVKWRGIRHSLQYFVQDTPTGNQHFKTIEDSADAKLAVFGKYNRKWIVEETESPWHPSKKELISLTIYDPVTKTLQREIPAADVKNLLTPPEFKILFEYNRSYFSLEPANGIVKIVSDFIFDNIDHAPRNWLYWENENRLVTIDCGLSCGTKGTQQHHSSGIWKDFLNPSTCQFKEPFNEIRLSSLPERVKARILDSTPQTILDVLDGLQDINKTAIVERVSLIRSCLSKPQSN